MTLAIDIADFHMWFVLGLTGLAVYLYARERFSLDVTSILLLTILLVFGQVFPLPNDKGQNMLDAASLLSGFANPALVAVLALLVMGQAIIHTDSLRPLIRFFVKSKFMPPWLSIIGILIIVMGFSAFLNNTPLVIIAIPIIQAVAARAGVPDSRVMMPLSFVAILGGTTTLVGSSTNLLVSSAMVELGYRPLQFFEFLVPGLILAGVGFVYCLLILPRLVPNRVSMSDELRSDEKEFIAELDIHEGSSLIGMECVEGRFAALPDLDIRMIQRSGHIILPPFEGYKIESDDILIVASKREGIVDLLSKYPAFLLSEDEESHISLRGHEGSEEGDSRPAELEEKIAESRVLAEVMITPTSRMVDMTIDQAGFHRQFGAVVLGIQRRARVVRRRLGRVRLESGDVLLVAGTQRAINDMRDNPDLIVLSGSKRELPVPKKAPIALLIFALVVLAASTGFMSIAVAAIAGSVLLVATGCLNIRQATRAIDRKILVLVGTMLALGQALQVTEGAQYIANLMMYVPFADNPLFMASFLFIVVAFMTNILSNNACAILFTPIALNMAASLGVEPVVFALTVLFAANCSFASPIGYKTNLLVMGPGHYRFRDFMKAGIPLVLLLWGAYIFIAKYYYHL